MKEIVKKLLFQAGILPAMLRNRKRQAILMLHGVGNAAMPVESFEKLLVELTHRFEIGRIDDLVNGVGHETAKSRVYLTFDDGLRNNATLAYPLLVKHRVPATFYVCPGLVGSPRWIWTHEVRERLRSLDSRMRDDLVAAMLGDPLPLEAAMTRLKDLPVRKRMECEALVSGATPRFSPSAAQRRAYDLMDWDELASMDPEWITVGSHSMSHAMLDSATTELAEQEVCESRALLESRLEREVIHFCYPDGRIGPEAEEYVRRTYKSAVTSSEMSMTVSPRDPYRMPRIGALSASPELFWSIWRASVEERN